MTTHKIWLDTDIGSDIDDALALAFLLSRPDCELLGISTVTEIENQRAQLASVLCRVAEKEVPIFPGARTSLLIEAPQNQVQQVRALEIWSHQTDFAAPAFAAIEAMRAAIYACPGEVTLLGIGPLTNIALLFAIDPQIPRMLRQLVLMCGVFEPSAERCEWNALNDPHATAMVYRAPVENHISFGLGVTEKVALERTEFEDKLRQSKFGAPILDMARAWFEHKPRVVFHDPLAAAAIFAPDLCEYRRARVEVETSDGRTRCTPEENGPHQIAFEVDAPRFFEMYFEALAEKPARNY